MKMGGLHRVEACRLANRCVRGTRGIRCARQSVPIAYSSGKARPQVSELQRDLWCQWLLNRRFGGDADRLKATMDYLNPVRDKVLAHSNLGENETLLDVGCGDGLIGFGALEKFSTTNVIFSDISQDLLDHSRTVAEQMGLLSRSQFVCVPAEALSVISDQSVEAVTTRSVLIYVREKSRAFSEFYRVLKSSGRLSIFEPINSFGSPEPTHMFWGYQVAPVVEIAQKLKILYRGIQPLGTDPMFDFDERRLMELAKDAGFREIHLEMHAELKPADASMNWNTFVRVAPNPKIPTLEEAMRQVLAPDEEQAFVAHLQPLVETGRGVSKAAVAYLWAIR
jgi:arsenite methyltransferase